ncbi:LANO_0A01420g1_1 [Lachancea nothofagi CBS 11611]|uniref:aminodeoxychorismate synthase n=1 Tax=Lachancea nothofagi CBS 11611 TaxID=1266666 RepID=A0A1G4IN03_9SACH|nr:LANO_0A01420g1_1 [Lachancea nothofagi CBS 11611]
MVVNVLFVDSYDSFTYNLVNLIRAQDKQIHVTIIHNDTFATFDEVRPFLSCFDCIVVGPGPGNPENGCRDVGLLHDMFSQDLKVPVLGICLGFQVMCRAMGCPVKQLKEIKHGQVYDITVANLESKSQNELFAEYPAAFKSVRYHSLHVAVDSDSSEGIIPLCYTHDENGPVLMGAKIAETAWYGVQYHPESCCSELGGQLISNFLRIAKEYNDSKDRKNSSYQLLDNSSQKQTAISFLDKTIDKSSVYEKTELKDLPIYVEDIPVTPNAHLALIICNVLNVPFFLMSSSTIQDNRGEYSIIALPNERSTVFTHYDQKHKTLIHKWRDSRLSHEKYMAAVNDSHAPSEGLESINEDKFDFWKTVGNFMKDRMVASRPDIPFIGGLVGVLGYEMGQFTVNGDKEKLVPDAKLVFIENSIIVDLKKGTVSFVSLNNNFPESVKGTVRSLMQDNSDSSSLLKSKKLPHDVGFDIRLPTRDAYAKAFKKSQNYLHNGDSYEVCLTTQTEVKPSKRVEPWRLFQTLIQRNPAPFSSFFEFSDLCPGSSHLCLLSTSPERFLKWDRNGCELRPIKGTVKKDHSVTLESATKILKTPKEFGENLMILDLIRNDLYELLDSVTVDELMSVEEYETVYQLVSVVKGHNLRQTAYSGIDLLRHSLPAGSMTGAPKKNTVQLLQNEIETELNSHISSAGVRGVYSGVTGYWSCNDRGDWSVNIRCMYSYDNANSWRLGAGGAITVLSTLDGEWEEMHTKLESALQVFQDA